MIESYVDKEIKAGKTDSALWPSTGLLGFTTLYRQDIRGPERAWVCLRSPSQQRPQPSSYPNSSLGRKAESLLLRILAWA